MNLFRINHTFLHAQSNASDTLFLYPKPLNNHQTIYYDTLYKIRTHKHSPAYCAHKNDYSHRTNIQHDPIFLSNYDFNNFDLVVVILCVQCLITYRTLEATIHTYHIFLHRPVHPVNLFSCRYLPYANRNPTPEDIRTQYHKIYILYTKNPYEYYLPR